MRDTSVEEARALVRRVAGFMTLRASDTVAVRAAKVGFKLSAISMLACAASVIVMSPSCSSS
jgi:hypothetical protein